MKPTLPITKATTEYILLESSITNRAVDTDKHKTTWMPPNLRNQHLLNYVIVHCRDIHKLKQCMEQKVGETTGLFTPSSKLSSEHLQKKKKEKKTNP